MKLPGGFRINKKQEIPIQNWLFSIAEGDLGGFRIVADAQGWFRVIPTM
jgi:hypothetical protein